MSTEWIISQVFVAISYGLIGVTYFVKNRKFIIIYNLASILANSVAFFLLSAWSAFYMTGVAILRNIAFLIQEKFEGKRNKIGLSDWLILAGVMVLSIIVSVFTYNGVLSLFSIIATLTYSISVWQKNYKVYRVLGILCSVFWITYYAFIQSWFSIGFEAVLFVAEIVGTILAFIKPKSVQVEVVSESNIKENIEEK